MTCWPPDPILLIANENYVSLSQFSEYKMLFFFWRKIDLALVEHGELWISICFEFSPEAFVRKVDLTFWISITISHC